MMALYDKMVDYLRREDMNISLVPVVHGLSSCLKSYCTSYAVDSVEQARRVCGGHGYG
jgi:acyl-CoA oxidase